MNLDLNLVQLSAEQLLELVRQLIAENERLLAENAQLRAEIEELKRKNARPAAPFSKNKRKKNPKRPGRKPGQGPFGSNSCLPPVPTQSAWTNPEVAPDQFEATAHRLGSRAQAAAHALHYGEGVSQLRRRRPAT